MLAATSSRAREVEVLAARRDGHPSVWLVNLTGSPQRVRMQGLGPATSRLRLLDEASFETVCRDPEAFERRAEPTPSAAVELPAYAVAMVG